MKYFNTYFRVNTIGYDFNKGFDPEDRERFKNEVIDIFTKNGWGTKKEKYNHGCTTMIKGSQSLYMHPQSFSGIVEENDIPLIKNFVKDAKTFEFYRTDVYEEIHDMDDDSYIKYLKENENEIRGNLLKLLRTTRKHLFVVDMYEVTKQSLKGIKLKRLCDETTMVNSVESDFILSIIDQLVQVGYVVKSKTSRGMGYRTINKTEQKQLKVDLAC